MTDETDVFADKNASIGKAIAISGFKLGGRDSANYNVVQPLGVVDIGKARLALTRVTANDETKKNLLRRIGFF